MASVDGKDTPLKHFLLHTNEKRFIFGEGAIDKPIEHDSTTRRSK